jgi:rfaE bifunctional protein nucleotidyltransferase chain/domain
MTETGIYSIAQLYSEINSNPDRWRPLVFTNGCFDLLHPGHVRYLKAAKACGKSLVVGLNSDASVRQIKPPQPGKPDRPIVTAEHRAEVLAALKSVDAVVIFDEPTASDIILALKPEIYVKGGDYTTANLPEAPTVQAYGGEIKFIQVEVPTSTTAIVQKIMSIDN